MTDMIFIKGVDMGSLAAGERAVVLLEDGRWVSTSPIKRFCVTNSTVMVETQNHIYRTK